MRLFGKNPILERLRSQPETVRKIYLQEGVGEWASIRRKAKQSGILIVTIPKTKMDKLSRHANSQGIMADVSDFEYANFDDMLDQAFAKKHTLIFLDNLTDPQNLGAIIRSVGCLGHFCIVIPTHKSVSVTEAVLRVASGGENHVQITQVSNLVNAIKKAKNLGFHTAGAIVDGTKVLDQIELPFPMAVIVGSEQKGVRDIIRKHLDFEITIPMTIERMSFNVAHATTIICYEITRQKRIIRARNVKNAKDFQIQRQQLS